jgi:hypothetical protein
VEDQTLTQLTPPSSVVTVAVTDHTLPVYVRNDCGESHVHTEENVSNEHAVPAQCYTV